MDRVSGRFPVRQETVWVSPLFGKHNEWSLRVEWEPTDSADTDIRLILCRVCAPNDPFRRYRVSISLAVESASGTSRKKRSTPLSWTDEHIIGSLTSAPKAMVHTRVSPPPQVELPSTMHIDLSVLEVPLVNWQECVSERSLLEASCVEKGFVDLHRFAVSAEDTVAAVCQKMLRALDLDGGQTQVWVIRRSTGTLARLALSTQSMRAVYEQFGYDCLLFLRQPHPLDDTGAAHVPQLQQLLCIKLLLPERSTCVYMGSVVTCSTDARQSALERFEQHLSRFAGPVTWRNEPGGPMRNVWLAIPTARVNDPYAESFLVATASAPRATVTWTLYGSSAKDHANSERLFSARHKEQALVAKNAPANAAILLQIKKDLRNLERAHKSAYYRTSDPRPANPLSLSGDSIATLRHNVVFGLFVRAASLEDSCRLDERISSDTLFQLAFTHAIREERVRAFVFDGAYLYGPVAVDPSSTLFAMKLQPNAATRLASLDRLSLLVANKPSSCFLLSEAGLAAAQRDCTGGVSWRYSDRLERVFAPARQLGSWYQATPDQLTCFRSPFSWAWQKAAADWMQEEKKDRSPHAAGGQSTN